MRRVLLLAVLLVGCNRTNSVVEEAAAPAAGATPPEPQVVSDEQTQLLRYGTDDEKVEAARQAGEGRKLALVDTLIRGLPGESDRVKYAFVEALGEIGSRRAVLPLVVEMNRPAPDP